MKFNNVMGFGVQPRLPLLEVVADISLHARPCRFGPFESRDEAERTLTALAGRSDVAHAKIVEYDPSNDR